MYSVLVVDDEKKIREIIDDYLSAKGLNIVTAADGEEAVRKAADSAFDLIILDVMMPKLNGIEACKEIREFSDVPILFLSALGEEADLLKGFGAGADDYVVKPFPLSVLEKKCRQMIRRSKGAEQGETLTVSGITIDYSSHKVYVDYQWEDANDANDGDNEASARTDINLVGKDFALLAYLMENKDVVLDREKILDKVWGYGFEGDTRVVDTHVKNIRKALGEKGSLIETVTGIGYRFRQEEF